MSSSFADPEPAPHSANTPRRGISLGTKTSSPSNTARHDTGSPPRPTGTSVRFVPDHELARPGAPSRSLEKNGPGFRQRSDHPGSRRPVELTPHQLQHGQTQIRRAGAVRGLIVHERGGP